LTDPERSGTHTVGMYFFLLNGVRSPAGRASSGPLKAEGLTEGARGVPPLKILKMGQNAWTLRQISGPPSIHPSIMSIMSIDQRKGQALGATRPHRTERTPSSVETTTGDRRRHPAQEEEEDALAARRAGRRSHTTTTSSTTTTGDTRSIISPCRGQANCGVATFIQVHRYRYISVIDRSTNYLPIHTQPLASDGGMGLGLPPAQVRLATLVLFLLSLLVGGTVLVSNYRTWRARPSSSATSRGQDLHSTVLYITTAVAVASIVSGLVGFAGGWVAWVTWVIWATWGRLAFE
jgi:hypothetical protein